MVWEPGKRRARQAVFKTAEDAGYQVVVLDTPSGLHGPTEGILRSSSHVLVPQQCEPLALRSLMLTVDFLNQLQPRTRMPARSSASS